MLGLVSGSKVKNYNEDKNENHNENNNHCDNKEENQKKRNVNISLESKLSMELRN